MKQLLLIISILILFVIGCNSKVNQTDFIGEWKVVECQVNFLMELSPNIVKATEDELLSCVYTFKPDKTYNVVSNLLPEGYDGKYELDIDNNILILFDSSEVNGDNANNRFNIKLFTSQSMNWEQELTAIGTSKISLEKLN